MQRRYSLKALAAIATIAGLSSLPAHAQDTIKVGVLHSLSGTMAISETTLKDTVLFLIDEQNKKGGVLGKKVEIVPLDNKTNPQESLIQAQKAIDSGAAEAALTKLIEVSND